MTDQELMKRFSRQGDTAAYEELVRRWDRRVLSFLYKACGDFEAAKDLRQDVFLRVYRYGKSFRPEHAFTAWLFRIASNTLRTWKGKEARRAYGVRRLELLTPPVDAQEPNGPYEAAQFAEIRETVRGALDSLNPQERELLLLRFELGMNYREMAEVLDAPETTLKSRLYALLRRLRQSLQTEAGASQRRLPQ